MTGKDKAAKKYKYVRQRRILRFSYINCRRGESV